MSPQETSPSADTRGIGERLRAAREAKGLGTAQVAATLKMPVHVIEALEREDWSVLGAAVFVRGQLRSYARLLGLDAEAVGAKAGPRGPGGVERAPRPCTPRLQRLAEQTRMRLVYVVLTATIAVPVWLAMRSHVGNGGETTVPLGGASAADAADATSPADGRALPANAPARPAPLVASMTPRPSAPAPGGDLNLRFEGESWVSLAAPDGAMLEEALVPAGTPQLLLRADRPGHAGQCHPGPGERAGSAGRSDAVHPRERRPLYGIL